MRHHALALLFIAAVVNGTPAAEKEAPRRLFGKSEKSQPIQVVVMNDVESLPPAQASPIYPTPLAGTPVLDCSSGTMVAPFEKDCPGGLCNGKHPRLERPRPAQECLGCSSFRCEWRFLWGGCRAYFGQGPFSPTYPDNCPCGRR